MKILHVIGSMDPSTGGPCQGLRNIVPGLIKLGINSVIISLDDENAEFLKNDYISIKALGKGKGKWQYQKRLIPWLDKHILEFHVIIIHGLWIFNGFAVHKVLENKKKISFKSSLPKLFIMPHGMLDPYFQEARERRFKAIRNWFYWKLIERKIINDSNGLMFTCTEELLLARKTFRPYLPKMEINLGYGIINPPFFTESQEKAFFNICPQVANSSYILFLSRIHEKKGVDLLVKAYCQLKEAIPDLPNLVIAGPGLETAYGQRIKEIASISQNIFFTGMLTGEAKWGAFYSCEVFILPSHQENFGIAVVEAMACGKSVLVSNKVNIWKEIKAGKGGIIANDTLDGTSQLLNQWISFSEKEKEEYSLNARKIYLQEFTNENVAKRISQFIK